MCLLIDGVAGLASVRGWVLSAASMGRSRLRLVDERRSREKLSQNSLQEPFSAPKVQGQP